MAMKKHSGVQLFDDFDSASTRKSRKEHAKMLHGIRQAERGRAALVTEAKFPNPKFGSYGLNRRNNLRGKMTVGPRPHRATTFSFATAYPYLAGNSLGYQGAYIGNDFYGGGAFCFDAWEQYKAGNITGMSMVLMGAVGTGKSTCAKSLVCRSVLLGRKAAILSDRKGEWTKVVRWMGGQTISVGPGQDAKINPLDPGTRPKTAANGDEMTDIRWAALVRSRRLSLLKTLAEILIHCALKPAEHTALSRALDQCTNTLETPTLPDIISALRTPTETTQGMLVDAAETLGHALGRCTEGDLQGMFDGHSTVNFDADLPIISIDTSPLTGASEEARRITSACTGAWVESMITTRDAGQRICVYEEGWDNMSDEASLTRMVEAWKLARDYGINNLLVIHKIGDLDMAGDSGSKMSAMAKSLLADAEVRIVYRQETNVLKVTKQELGLSDAQIAKISTLRKGQGLWLVGARPFVVDNIMTAAEKPYFDTDEKMDKIS